MKSELCTGSRESAADESSAFFTSALHFPREHCLLLKHGSWLTAKSWLSFCLERLKFYFLNLLKLLILSCEQGNVQALNPPQCSLYLSLV